MATALAKDSLDSAAERRDKAAAQYDGLVRAARGADLSAKKLEDAANEKCAILGEAVGDEQPPTTTLPSPSAAGRASPSAAGGGGGGGGGGGAAAAPAAADGGAVVTYEPECTQELIGTAEGILLQHCPDAAQAMMAMIQPGGEIDVAMACDCFNSIPPVAATRVNCYVRGSSHLNPYNMWRKCQLVRP